MAILISDGMPNMEVDREYEEAKRLKDAGTHIIAVGITDEVQMELLYQLASTPSHVFKLEDYFSLKYILDPIMALACVEAGK